MFVLILQSALLLAIAYILGCIIGCLLRTLMGGDEVAAAPAAGAATATVAAGGAAVAAGAAKPAPAPKPKPKPAEPARAPEPVALMGEAPKKKAPAKKPAAAKKATTAKKAPAAKKAAPAKKKSGAAGAPPPAGTKVDNLKLIRGIGRQNEARLQAFGVTMFQQIADWTQADADEWGTRLAFPGRIEREDWIGQAKVLASGGSTPFASRVRQGGVSTSQGQGTIGDLGKKPALLEKARAAGPDNLTLIDGVGNALEKRLFAIGIFHFDQIAKLSAAEAKWVGIAVGFPGRVERENWVEESKTLAAGGMTDHAKRVEEGKIATSRVSTDTEKKK